MGYCKHKIPAKLEAIMCAATEFSGDDMKDCSSSTCMAQGLLGPLQIARNMLPPSKQQGPRSLLFWSIIEVQDGPSDSTLY